MLILGFFSLRRASHGFHPPQNFLLRSLKIRLLRDKRVHLDFPEPGQAANCLLKRFIGILHAIVGKLPVYQPLVRQKPLPQQERQVVQVAGMVRVRAARTFSAAISLLSITSREYGIMSGYAGRISTRAGASAVFLALGRGTGV